MIKFIKSFLGRLSGLLLKLVGSRKAFFQIISKLLTLHLVLTLKNELYIVVVFMISSIADFVYFGIIEFEKVKTEVNLRK